MSMDTNRIVEDILTHHGIKGMHWGIRKNPEARAAKKQARSERRATRKEARRVKREARWQAYVARQDQKFEDLAKDFGTKVEVHNRAGDLMDWHGDIDRINNKSEYIQAAQHGILLKDDHPVTQKYHKEYTQAYLKRVNEAANEFTNWSDTRKYVAKPSSDFLGFSVSTAQIQHASDPYAFEVKFVKDSKGFITGLEIVNNSMAQAALFVDRYLEHHGVKGQKWGVRRAKASIAAKNAEARKPKPVSVETKQRGGKSTIKTKGGENQPVHPDAVAARTTGQQAKRSGLDTLSNKELQAYANRLDLEQRVSRLESQDQHGKNFVQKFFANKKNREATKKFLNDEKNQENIKKGAQAVKAARTARKVAKAVS